MVKAAARLSRLELPVRLIALPEGALQGFDGEVLNLDHVRYARECAIDIPPDWKDRFFNVGFILDPKGEVILRHYLVHERGIWKKSSYE